MNFQVPQFIEIEDKVFGPLSFKQFIYVTGAAGLAFILYVFLPFYVAIIPIGIVIVLGLALAFYQINNRPFIVTLQSALRYQISNKLYLWKQSAAAQTITYPLAGTADGKLLTPPKLSKSKLADLSWSLDVKEKIQ